MKWSVVWKGERRAFHSRLSFSFILSFTDTKKNKSFSFRSLVLSMHAAYAYESKLWWTHSLSLFSPLLKCQHLFHLLSFSSVVLYSECGVLQQEILKSKAIEKWKYLLVAWKLTTISFSLIYYCDCCVRNFNEYELRPQNRNNLRTFFSVFLYFLIFETLFFFSMYLLLKNELRKTCLRLVHRIQIFWNKYDYKVFNAYHRFLLRNRKAS